MWLYHYIFVVYTKRANVTQHDISKTFLPVKLTNGYIQEKSNKNKHTLLAGIMKRLQ